MGILLSCHHPSICSDPYHLAKLLTSTKPHFIILYNADLKFVRQVEVIKSYYFITPLPLSSPYFTHIQTHSLSLISLFLSLFLSLSLSLSLCLSLCLCLNLLRFSKLLVLASLYVFTFSYMIVQLKSRSVCPFKYETKITIANLLQIYLTSVRKEKDSFHQLIREKAVSCRVYFSL